jgi:hypothetical protein
MKGVDRLLLRIAFMDSTASGKRRDVFLETLLISVQDYIEELESYYAKQSRHLPMGGKLAFERGLESYKSMLTWAQKVKSVYTSK